MAKQVATCIDCGHIYTQKELKSGKSCPECGSGWIAYSDKEKKAK